MHEIPALIARGVTPLKALTRSQVAVIAALVILTISGGIIRSWEVYDRPLWEDEAYTWQDCQKPYWKLLWWKHDPTQGPVSHLLVRHSMQLFGTDAPWALRMPSLVCGILCIPVAFWLGRTIHGSMLGLVAASLVAVDVNMVDQSQQARMYTMLALASMLVIIQAVRLLKDPPARRRPWIALALLMSIQLAINFGAIALWIGLACVAIALAAAGIRAGGNNSEHARLLLRGILTTYAWAVLFSARGLWRFYIFLRMDRGTSAASFSETLSSAWQRFVHLTCLGPMAAASLFGMAVGLVLLWRRSREAALVLSATALITVVMIVAGRSVHHMIAPRYFTMLQPTLWIALAASIALAGSMTRRAIGMAAVTAGMLVMAWQATHLDRWTDLNTWRYARCAARFIHHSRAGGDFFACTPAINFSAVARYYRLIQQEDVAFAEEIHRHSQIADGDNGRAIWMQAYMFDPRAENELRDLLYTSRASEQLAIAPEELVAVVRDRGLTIVRIADDRFDAWAYDSTADTFRLTVSMTIADRSGVRAASEPRTPGVQ